jgi:glycerol-3-phosphate dehydrogenase (NAD(P)+)
VTSGLARLIAGDLPLEDWMALVRTTVPPPARWRPTVRRPARPFWTRQWDRVRRPLRRGESAPLAEAAE